MIREVGLRRNNESPTLPSGFNCCAEGLGISVFTQPGLDSDIVVFATRPVVSPERLRPEPQQTRVKDEKIDGMKMGSQHRKVYGVEMVSHRVER